MIRNTDENRKQYLKRATDRVKILQDDKWSIPISARYVHWGDPKVEGFVILPETPDVTEEEDRAWDEVEKRMDVIGQNGNDGEHYDTFKEAIDQIETATLDLNTMERVDNVNHPEHYQSDEGIECIDAIKAALTPEEFRGYCKGNAIKYLWRERMKGGDESLKKANWYINKELTQCTQGQ